MADRYTEIGAIFDGKEVLCRVSNRWLAHQAKCDDIRTKSDYLQLAVENYAKIKLQARKALIINPTFSTITLERTDFL